MVHAVEVLSRKDCHLCDEALAIVEEVCASQGLSFTVRDVDEDPVLKARFGDEVPVVLVDGEVVGFWRIRAELLRDALAR